MIASARLIFGSLPREPPGRPRIYKNSKEADHAYYIRKRDRRKMRAISPNNGHPMKDVAVAIAETIVAAPVSLRQRLEEACQANYDACVSVEPIEALLAQGCDLEADILPTVARTVPELPRPLKTIQRTPAEGLFGIAVKLAALDYSTALDEALSISRRHNATWFVGSPL
jgi:hypothetical protein